MASADVEQRERPRQANIYLGMLLFLLSEAFLFGALFWSYFDLRGNNFPHWPPEGVHLGLLLVSINTAILLASSGAMQWAIVAIRRGSRGGLIGGLLATMLLGSTFLVIKGWEWATVPFRPWSHAYGSIFYTMTGFHALHVLAGILILLALLLRARRHRFSAERHLAVEVGGLYWHFVDLVWLFVFTSIYLIQ
ncbi:MAG: heme-copper oxidase subunit III [Dehalococcoidia bacterium]